MADKFFVIGSNSFTGASFVDFLLTRGDEVIGTSRSTELNPVFLPYRWPAQRPAAAKFQFQQLDLNQDTDRLVASGLIDSLAILQIVAYLETTYGIDFSIRGVSPEELGSIGGILDVIEQGKN